MFVNNFKKIAFTDTYSNKATSYSDLLAGIKFIRKILVKNRNNKIAIYSENSPRWAMAFYACWEAKAVPIPIDYMSTSEELEYILKDSDASVIFVTHQTYANALRALENLDTDIDVIILDELTISKNIDEINEVTVPDDIDKTAIIIYTSGTTGGPKGVMLSFRSVLLNVQAISEDVNIFEENDIVLALLPFHHALPLIGTLVAPMYVGATIAIPKSFATQDIIGCIRKNKVTILLGVPRFFNLIHQGIMNKLNKLLIGRMMFGVASFIDNMRFSRFLFSSIQKQFGGCIKVCPCGGAAIDAKVERDLRLLGFNLITGYGMTETGPLISFPSMTDYRPQTVGRPLRGLDVKIIDGEICVRGDNVMQGYLNRPEDTSKAIVDGYLRTGDLGHFDAHGFLCISGRKKELIVLPNGKNVSPDEIEFKLSRISEIIDEVAVVFYNRTLSTIIRPDVKFIAKNNILNLNQYIQAEIIDIYNREVAPYKKIARFTLIKEPLPRTRLGKIKRFDLDRFLNRSQTKIELTPEPDYEEYFILKEFFNVTQGLEVFPDDHIEIDLSMDSLDKVNLISFIESTFGMKFTEKDLLEHLQIKSLSDFLREHKSKIEVSSVDWRSVILDVSPTKLSRPSTLFSSLLAFSKLSFNLLFRVKVTGQEFIPSSPCIIAPNHQSYFDAGFLLCGLKRSIRYKTFFGAKEKHIGHPLLRPIIKRGNIIPIDLNNGLMESIGKMTTVLKSGGNLVIFPEGTRSHSGELKEFKKLFAILAKELNIPIIPVTINGAFDVLPRGSYIPKLFKQINVSFLPPIFPYSKTEEEISLEAMESIRRELKLQAIKKLR